MRKHYHRGRNSHSACTKRELHQARMQMTSRLRRVCSCPTRTREEAHQTSEVSRPMSLTVGSKHPASKIPRNNQVKTSKLEMA